MAPDGFQLYPPLRTIPDLIRWKNFIEILKTFFESSILIDEERIIFHRFSNRPYFPADGYYFREIRFVTTHTSLKLVTQLIHFANESFPSRIFSLETPRYSVEELNSVNDMISAARMRQEALFVHEEFSYNRHCAFCTTKVEICDAIICPGCNKRAYCSNICLNLDKEKSGQDHMLWCSLNCCEEDIDWVLQPIRGKGLGVVAKRFIPMMSRILVDPVRDVTFPGVLDLQPINGTLLDKERLNSFRSSDESMLFIRVARMNHDCNANASQAFDEDSRVMLVVANRDIHPGEEICINYTNLNGKSGYCSPDEARLILRDKWGIVCADTCKCFDIEYSKMLTRCRDLDHELNRMIYAGNPAGGLLKVDELLGLLDIVNATWTWKRRANWKGFKIAIMRPDTLKLASIYGRRAVCIYSAISHPASDKAKVFEQAVEDPSSHKHFLPKVTRQSA